MRYIKELDSLRAIAVVAVMFQHYLAQYRILAIFGSSGVTLFFVLSGFLISQILLSEKELFKINHQNHTNKIKQVLKVFYIRRSLRIFPVFYLTLILLLIFNIDSARPYFGFHFLYLSNFLYTFKVPFDRLIHFWSLAVEEQFYLFWPLIILFLPLKVNLIKFFSLMVVASLLFKIIMIFAFSEHSFAATFLMPSCIESFAMGALVTQLNQQYFKRNDLIAFSLSILLVFIMLQYPIPSFDFINKLFGRLIFSVFSATLLIMLLQPISLGLFRNILTFRPLVYLGKISYGIYVYHMFIPTFFIFMQGKLNINLKGSGVNLLLQFFTTFLIAHLSFILIEKPINKLKNKFNYI